MSVVLVKEYTTGSVLISLICVVLEITELNHSCLISAKFLFIRVSYVE